MKVGVVINNNNGTKHERPCLANRQAHGNMQLYSHCMAFCITVIALVCKEYDFHLVTLTNGSCCLVNLTVLSPDMRPVMKRVKGYWLQEIGTHARRYLFLINQYRIKPLYCRWARLRDTKRDNLCRAADTWTCSWPLLHHAGSRHFDSRYLTGLPTKTILWLRSVLISPLLPSIISSSPDI